MDFTVKCVKEVILTTVKIFQFLHSPYCISGQYVLCRKENLIVREYMYKQKEGVARKYNSADTPFLLHSPVQMKYGAVAISFDATRYGINFSTESEYLVSVCLNATAPHGARNE